MGLLWEYIIRLAQNGKMLVLIIGFFMVGFIIKTAGSMCYDGILDYLGNYQFSKSRLLSGIISGYENEVRMGKNISNTEAFVEREMHKWKIAGMTVEKISGYGEICGKLCMIIGIMMSVLILITADNLSAVSFEMKNLYIYIGVSVMLWILLRLWQNVIALDYKREKIKDEIINYLDNHPDINIDAIPKVCVAMNDDNNINKNNISKNNINNNNTDKDNINDDNTDKDNINDDNTDNDNINNDNINDVSFEKRGGKTSFPLIKRINEIESNKINELDSNKKPEVEDNIRGKRKLKSEKTNIAKSEETNIEKSEKTNIEKSEKTNIAKSEKTNIAKSEDEVCINEYILQASNFNEPSKLGDRDVEKILTELLDEFL